ncbi:MULTISPECIES: GntR family transcriptional regulator [Prauserella salsuginis group]|uniref:GntR family transcriptional regulator n=1 Tax=Prauserella salsuginis TaxID=387889 RepID=A0ABW6G0L1_9PSEU|nr:MULTISPECIES: GntR family transcriptional regulator [Prauserella salsuginis group]MCR3721906.1 DNA-binding transcriptional regulator, GntR family [Prauserella flava]MCR3735911.1 DNA-binding transcriptional regulator, GntR family [Prauserella salsuginis]
MTDPSLPSHAGRARQSMTERVYEAIKREILTVRRRPESPLLEHELATEYGVSKTPVREALRHLVHEGWVLVLPRKGYMVQPLRFDDVREIFALRQLIEPYLVVEAAKRASPEGLDHLESFVDAQERATDHETAMEAAAAFHLGIAELAANQRASRILTGLIDEARRMYYLAPKLDSRLHEQAEFTDHRELVNAMRRQDIAQAHAVMERHSQESLRQKLEGLADF